MFPHNLLLLHFVFVIHTQTCMHTHTHTVKRVGWFQWYQRSVQFHAKSPSSYLNLTLEKCLLWFIKNYTHIHQQACFQLQQNTNLLKTLLQILCTKRLWALTIHLIFQILLKTNLFFKVRITQFRFTLKPLYILVYCGNFIHALTCIYVHSCPMGSDLNEHATWNI